MSKLMIGLNSEGGTCNSHWRRYSGTLGVATKISVITLL